MDWKIPATIIIIAIIISLGAIPFFPSKNIEPLDKVFGSINKVFERIFNKNQEFEEKILFTLRTDNISNLKIGSPVIIKIKNPKKEYILKLDDKKVILNDDINLINFTGTLSFRNFTISGEALKIETKNFKIEGKSSVIADQEPESLLILGLKIGELTIKKGKLTTEKPQKLTMNIENNTVKIFGINSNLTFEKGVLTINGTCSKIEAPGFFG